MPFRVRQKMQSYSCGKIVFQNLDFDDTTNVGRIVDVSQQSKLPDCKNTDLEVQLKAGVPLKKVNCQLIESASGTAFLEELSKVETKLNDDTKSTQEDK